LIAVQLGHGAGGARQRFNFANGLCIGDAGGLTLLRGAAHGTPETTAKLAGVSKRGLLYHFPYAKVLLESMLDPHSSEGDAHLSAGGAARTAWPSCADLFFERVRVRLELRPKHRVVGAALIATSADNPTLLAGCRTGYRELLDEFAWLPSGFERAALVLLAVDGLLLGELLRLSPSTPAERARLVKALLRAVDQCGSKP